MVGPRHQRRATEDREIPASPELAERGLGHDLLLVGATQAANQVVPPIAAKVKATFTPKPSEESPIILPPGADRDESL